MNNIRDMLKKRVIRIDYIYNTFILNYLIRKKKRI